MKRKRLENWLCLASLPAAAAYFAHIIVGSRLYPGYSNLSMAVSDLTAADSPVFGIASRFTSLYGALACLSLTILVLVLRGQGPAAFRRGIGLYALMNWISFAGYTLFPLSGAGYRGAFQDIVHLYVVTASVVLLSILSLSMIFAGGFRTRGLRAVSYAALTALAFMTAGPIGIGLGPESLFGFFERFSAFSAVLFTALLGVFGFLYAPDRTP